MSLMFILIVLLLLMAFFELLFSRSEWTQQIIYKVAFTLTVFVVSIKYYYGSDIIIYQSLYASINQMNLLGDGYFEPGFLLFLKCCKSIGLSFWWMTVVISGFYFFLLWKVFNKIPRYRVFALLILVALDYNLLFFELRQCLAVSFFILAYLLYEKKQTIQTLVCLLLMISCHKSGIFIVGLFMLAMGLKYFSVNSYVYGIITLVMLFCLMVPFEKILVALLDGISGSAAVKSILHHTLVTDTFQVVYVVYLVLLLVLFLLASKQKASFDAKLIFLMFCLVVVFAKYWFLLNRIRSYFIPIFLCYIFKNLDYIEDKLAKQLSYCVITVYIGVTSLMLYRSVENSASKINAPQTVFSLCKYTEEEILEKTQEKNKIFWAEEYVLEN